MLKRTKGFVSLAAAIALMLGLCSCSGKPETDPSTTADPTGIGAQAETGENTTAKDIAPESGAPETAAEEADTAEKSRNSPRAAEPCAELPAHHRETLFHCSSLLRAKKMNAAQPSTKSTA